MRSFFVLIISVFWMQFGYAQIHEIGFFLGGSNFIGDVGATNYISPNQLAIGGIYKWNRSPRHSWRLSIIYTNIEGDDSKSDDQKRVERGYKFKNSLLEISAGLEFTFWEFDLHGGNVLHTPYIFMGVSAANHDNSYFNEFGQTVSENSNSWSFGIPMALGFKTTLTEHFVLAAEIGARYTFTDKLDGSIPNNELIRTQYSFGNLNNNDWYVFTGITLTYTFGRNPCFCIYQ